MTGNEYQELAARTIDPALTRSQKEQHALFGIGSEAGEIFSLRQHEIQGEPINYSKLYFELGDLLWFIAEMCTALGISLEDVMRMNIDKLRRRYPAGFDADRSKHRHNYDSEA